MTKTSRGQRLRSVTAAMLFCAPLVAASCTSNHSAASPTTTSPLAVTSTQAPTTTGPPATNDAAVRPKIGALLNQWDVAMTSLREHPNEVIGHPDDHRRLALDKIFTDDSPFLADIDQLLSSYASGGVVAQPVTGGLAQHTIYLRTTQTPSADSLSFVWCSTDDSEDVQPSTGAVVNDQIGISQGGGEAKRVDGHWLLYRLFQLTHVAKPKGTPNPCPSFLSPAKATS